MVETVYAYTTGDALLEAINETGISYLFCNLGSDHPSMIEALAKAREEGKKVPHVIICPHESVALAAAHGFAMVTGQAQGVIVHTDVGTQNLGGAIHNAFRGRIPVFIFAGETPVTMAGERRGSRNSFVNYMQNVYDQHGILRSYVKWDHQIRTGQQVKQLVYRAMQLAHSAPAGPVYLTGAREVLEEVVEIEENTYHHWNTIQPAALSEKDVEELIQELTKAKNPLLICSYLGKNMKAVSELVSFCERLAIPVIEQHPSYLNFPRNHYLHLGYNSKPFVEEADFILAIDTDVPWVYNIAQPKDNCKVYYLDEDPIKEEIPLWHIPTMKNYRVDAYTVLTQLNRYLSTQNIIVNGVEERKQWIKNIHQTLRNEWETRVIVNEDQLITPEWLTACLRKVIDEETIVLDETITNTVTVQQLLPRTRPGTYYGSGGTSLGWNGGAAIGAKLANPDKTVVTLTGDGCYLFSIPSSVYWISKKYETPFLTVIYNNQGWNATKMNYLKLYPDGVARKTDRYWVNFDQPAELAKIAEAAGDVYAVKVWERDQLEGVLERAMAEVKNGRSAVVDVCLAKISNQKD